MGRVIHALVAPHSHQLTAADGTSLFVSDYLLPAGTELGSVVIMHGLGEHSGRYRHVAHFFNQCGLSVRCYDHRGHGRSQGRRGDVINGEPMVQDAQIVFDDFATRSSLPPFLFGHSMGGLFAARFALAQLSPVRGLILSSPALAVRLTPLDRSMLKALSVLAPFLGVPNGVQSRFLSHDSKVISAYNADPLVHAKISSRLLKAMLRSMAYCQISAGTLKVPTLILVAGDDRLVDAEGSRQFFAKAPTGMAAMHLYSGLYHELLNEPEAEQVMADIRRWLAVRFGVK